jgi:large subunit ribosomal protein L12e
LFADFSLLVFHKGNLTFEDVIHISRTIRPRSMAREFKGTVKEIVGTCVSVGCTIDGESPKEIMAKVVAGDFDDRFVNEK